MNGMKSALGMYQCVGCGDVFSVFAEKRLFDRDFGLREPFSSGFLQKNGSLTVFLGLGSRFL